MANLFDGKINVCYGQFYLGSLDREYYDQEHPLESAFRGQINGLCGGSDRGALFILTGLHTGYVRLRVTLLEEEPPIDKSWQEIVEVSLDISSSQVFLFDWDGQDYPINLPPGCYRVRYHANYMDEAHYQDTLLQHESTIDAYLLEIWPSTASKDLIIKQTSETAAYWHKWVLENKI